MAPQPPDPKASKKRDMMPQPDRDARSVYCVYTDEPGAPAIRAAAEDARNSVYGPTAELVIDPAVKSYPSGDPSLGRFRTIVTVRCTNHHDPQVRAFLTEAVQRLRAR